MDRYVLSFSRPQGRERAPASEPTPLYRCYLLLKEGIVIRSTEPVYSPLIGGDLSMKVISNKYLLKTKDWDNGAAVGWTHGVGSLRK